MEYMNGELEPMSDVTLVGRLPFGEGAIGKKFPLLTAEEEMAFGQELATYVRPLTITNTADCVDDRPTVALADSSIGEEEIKNRVTPQLPGGLGLAVTKAAVAADLALLRDTTGFKDAYTKMVSFLMELGYSEAAHKGCGASKLVEASIASEIPEKDIMIALPALTTVNEQTSYYFGRNWQTKRQRLEDGYYGDWSASWHESFVSDHFPQNFSILAEDPDDHETGGHHASGLLVIQRPGFGLAKTALATATGKMAFGETPSIIPELIHKIGGSSEERARLSLELGVDPAQVLNKLVIKEFPAFVQAA